MANRIIKRHTQSSANGKRLSHATIGKNKEAEFVGFFGDEAAAVDEKTPTDLKFIQGIKAYQMNASKAEPGSIAAHIRDIRILNRERREMGGSGVVTYTLRSMMAQTPTGRNAALSIYRGVQSYAG